MIGVFTKRDVLHSYRHHPLQEATILRRIRQQRGSLRNLCENDIAIDQISEITDQNHVGGIESVLDLAVKARIGSASKVLDLGCGLGGSARVLAETFGCNVMGLELSRKRYREACRLTRRVGLEKRVSFKCSDFLTARMPGKKFDVIWGQGAWIHVRNKRAFLRRWMRCLAEGGRIAMEEAVITARPRNGLLRKLLLDLEQRWHSYLVPRSVWCGIMEDKSYRIGVSEDHTQKMSDHFRKLLDIRNMISPPESEAIAWQNALRLTEEGILKYVRIVAEKAF